MKKKDYMKLTKERLAELLEERDFFDMDIKKYVPQFIPYQSQDNMHNVPCYAPDGICSNPFHDCINCPKQFSGGGTSSSTSTITINSR